MVRLSLQDLISAPPEHWIHKYWDAEEFKHPANPALGKPDRLYDVPLNTPPKLQHESTAEAWE
jgi:hypothetical protein